MGTGTRMTYCDAVAHLVDEVDSLFKTLKNNSQITHDIVDLTILVKKHEEELSLLNGVDAEISSVFDNYQFGTVVDFESIKSTLDRLPTVANMMGKVKCMIESLSPLPDNYHRKGEIVGNATLILNNIKQETTSDTIDKALSTLNNIADTLNELKTKLSGDSEKLSVKKKTLEENIAILESCADRYGCSKVVMDASLAIEETSKGDPRKGCEVLDTHISITEEVKEKFASEINQLKLLVNTIAGGQVTIWSDKRLEFLNELNDVIRSNPARSSSFDILKYKTRASNLMESKKREIDQYIISLKRKAKRHRNELLSLRETDSSYSKFEEIQRQIATMESERTRKITIQTLKIVGFCVALPIVIGYYILKFVFSMTDSSSNNNR